MHAPSIIRRGRGTRWEAELPQCAVGAVRHPDDLQHKGGKRPSNEQARQKPLRLQRKNDHHPDERDLHDQANQMTLRHVVSHQERDESSGKRDDYTSCGTKLPGIGPHTLRPYDGNDHKGRQPHVLQQPHRPTEHPDLRRAQGQHQIDTEHPPQPGHLPCLGAGRRPVQPRQDRQEEPRRISNRNAAAIHSPNEEVRQHG
ncbi:hypothetical protein SDC9_86202 [bioreactor metagenome]|uniref:Uncharacterized protein n=1 Tax=bioreactor metagenome TaxID=1076179 RepID=A0A644ZGX8_9ZZZZ